MALNLSPEKWNQLESLGLLSPNSKTSTFESLWSSDILDLRDCNHQLISGNQLSTSPNSSGEGSSNEGCLAHCSSGSLPINLLLGTCDHHLSFLQVFFVFNFAFKIYFSVALDI